MIERVTVCCEPIDMRIDDLPRDRIVISAWEREKIVGSLLL